MTCQFSRPESSDRGLGRLGQEQGIPWRLWRVRQAVAAEVENSEQSEQCSDPESLRANWPKTPQNIKPAPRRCNACSVQWMQQGLQALLGPEAPLEGICEALR